MGKQEKGLIEGNPNEICWCLEKCALKCIVSSLREIQEAVNFDK